MNLPIILLSGQAGAGKDTIASFLVKNHGAVALGFADPMKRFAQRFFHFDENQLWGPSAARNAVDERFIDRNFRIEIAYNLRRGAPDSFLAELLPTYDREELIPVQRKLIVWAEKLLEESSEGLTPRKMLQTFGTEWGRYIDRNMWVNATLRDAKLLLGGGYSYRRTIGTFYDEKNAGPEWVVITDGRFRNEIIEVRSLGGEAWKIISPETDSSAVEKAGVAGHASEAEQKSIPNHFFSAIVENDKSKGLVYAERLVKYIMWKDPRAPTLRMYTSRTVNSNLTHGV